MRKLNIVISNSSLEPTKANLRKYIPQSGKTSTLLKKNKIKDFEHDNLIQESLRCSELILGKYMKEFSVFSHEISSSSVYVLDPMIIEKIDTESLDAEALFDFNRRSILLSSDVDVLDIPSIIFHELTHAKGAFLYECNSGHLKLKSNGLWSKIYSENKDTYHIFSGLNEAVVSILEKRFFSEYFHSNSVCRDFHQEVIGGKNFDEKKAARISKKEGLRSGHIFYLKRNDYYYFAYVYLRDFFEDLIYQISKIKNISMTDVETKFFKAYFTGEKGELFRLLYDVFGSIKFRALAFMDASEESCFLVRNILKLKKAPV